MVETAALILGAIASLLTASSPYWVPMINHRLAKNDAAKAKPDAPVLQGLPVDDHADDAIDAERRRADEAIADRDYWRDRAKTTGAALTAANRDLIEAGLPPHLID